MTPPIVRDVDLELGRGGIDPGGSVLTEAYLTCYTGRDGTPATVTVNYGPTTAVASSSVPTPTGNFHRVPIPVTPGARTYYQIVATAVPGPDSTTRAVYGFTATPGLPVPGPTVTVGAPSGLTQTGATLNWTTATAQPKGSVRYGTTPGTLSLTASETPGADATAHTLALTGLTAGTRYYYRVVQPGNAPAPGPTVSAMQSFVTAP